MLYLEKFRKDIQRCVKCGGCQSACPTFEARGDEALMARGRMALIEALLDGRTGRTKALSYRIDTCLDCKSCTSYCPSGVPVDDIIYAAKAEIAGATSCSPFFRVPASITARPYLQKILLRLAGLIKKIIYDPLPQHFPLPAALKYRGKKRLLPDMGGRSFNETYAGTHTPDSPKGKVIFFAGCAINSIHQDTGKAALEVLKHNNIETVVMKDEYCCSIPLLSKGDRRGAERLARKNISLMNSIDADAVVTCCATCGSTLKGYKKWIEGEEAERFSSKVMDIHSYLVKNTDFKRGLGHLEKTVTWHDPCHLSRGQGIKDEPREILESIPGLNFVEMERPCHCCGFGGETSLIDYGLSMDVAEKKILSIKKSGTGQVVSGCPACKIHIEDAMSHYGLEGSVDHTVEILAQSYRSDIPD